MQLRTLALGVLLTWLLWATTSPALAQTPHGWPITPTDSEHPIGNSFGEFQHFEGRYFHRGIDILVDPKFDEDGFNSNTAENVNATVGGMVLTPPVDDGTGYGGKTLTVTGADGTLYRYKHIHPSSMFDSLVSDSLNGVPVQPGEQIGRVARWGFCDFHHLHYELEHNGEYLNPLATITPNLDPDPPEITGLSFAEDDKEDHLLDDWIPLVTTNAEGCTVVRGKVDIVAKLLDRDDAGQSLPGAATLGVYRIGWRVCPADSPDCDWLDTYTFDRMDVGWGESNGLTWAYYSARSPWESDSDYCKETWLYAVVTNHKSNVNATTGVQRLLPSREGTWDTTQIPNGRYIVSVHATDFAGNSSLPFSKEVCVDNP